MIVIIFRDLDEQNVTPRTFNFGSNTTQWNFEPLLFIRNENELCLSIGYSHTPFLRL